MINCRVTQKVLVYFLGIGLLALCNIKLFAQSVDVKPESLEPAITALDNRQIPKDLVLILDNSGSMKNNDPNFLLKNIVTQFVNKQRKDDRISIIVFDETVRIPLPLTHASTENRPKIFSTLSIIDYQGQYSDIPASIERAIYELSLYSRDDVFKAIIFITDGILDTGNTLRNIERIKWLKEGLTKNAKELGIQVYSIAFTKKADLELIQSISTATKGKYYRAPTTEELAPIFNKIHDDIDAAIIKSLKPKKPAALIETPIGPSPPAKEEESLMKIIIAIILLTICMMLLVLLVIRYKSSAAVASIKIPTAYLLDQNKVSTKSSHQIKKHITIISRTAGTEDQNLGYIVISKPSIGRRHALIEYKDHAFWLVDQGSINGTYVNGLQVRDKVRLKHGDILCFHKYKLAFSIPEIEDVQETIISPYNLSAQPIDEQKTAMINQKNPPDDNLDIDFQNTEIKDSLLDIRIANTDDNENIATNLDIDFTDKTNPP